MPFINKNIEIVRKRKTVKDNMYNIPYIFTLIQDCENNYKSNVSKLNSAVFPEENCYLLQKLRESTALTLIIHQFAFYFTSYLK